jgi:hypothetical protein
VEIEDHRCAALSTSAEDTYSVRARGLAHGSGRLSALGYLWSSRYGTWVNVQKIGVQNKARLKNGYLIHFTPPNSRGAWLVCIDRGSQRN